jgi:hypothetical protein
MENESFHLSLWRTLRAPEPNLAMRLAMSIVAALVLGAAGIAAAWAYAQFYGNGYVRDEQAAAAMSLAGACWFLVLILIWRPMRHGRQIAVPTITTLAIIVAAIAGSVAIDELLNLRDDEMLMFAVVLLGAAAVILVWLPTAQRLLRGRPVVGPDDLVRVNCPRCGYSLIGLRDLRCPECGTEFTIDELIRSQDYSGVRKVSAAEAESLNQPRPRTTPGVEGAGEGSEQKHA